MSPGGRGSPDGTEWAPPGDLPGPCRDRRIPLLVVLFVSAAVGLLIAVATTFTRADSNEVSSDPSAQFFDEPAPVTSSSVPLTSTTTSLTPTTSTTSIAEPEVCTGPIPKFESHGWNVDGIFAESDIRPAFHTEVGWRVWRFTRESDGAVVELQNPSTATLGDGFHGTISFGGSPASIVPNAHGKRPMFIFWSTSTSQPNEVCTLWNLISDDLGAVEIAQFAIDHFGATDLQWHEDIPPTPWPSEERLLELGTTFRDEMLDWPWDDRSTFQSHWAPHTARYFQNLTLPITDLTPADSDFWVFARGETGVNVLGAFSAIRDWEVVVGPHPVCNSPARDAPQEARFLSQISLVTVIEAASGCAGWVSIDLFLDDYETVRAVRVDTFEP